MNLDRYVGTVAVVAQYKYAHPCILCDLSYHHAFLVSVAATVVSFFLMQTHSVLDNI